MNIDYSKTLVDITGTLRQYVYNTELFQTTFSNRLEDISECVFGNIKITPDYYGGLDIEVYFDNYNVGHNSLIINALITSISSSYIGMDKAEFMAKVNEMGPNLANIIITGIHSLIIKI